MLTPDEGHLDRRIAQEAGTLVGAGWTVDIDPSVDPGLGYEADLPPGVRLLANPREPTPRGWRLRALRPLKRAATLAVPALGRTIEAAQYRMRDIAGEITAGNLARLLERDPYDLIVAHDVPVMSLAARLKVAWGARLISDLHEVFPEQDEHFTSETARRYWRALESDGLAASDGIICVNPAIATYVRERYDPAVPIAVVHNAVPYVAPAALLGSMTLRSLYPIPDGSRTLLFAGSLRPHAGLEVLITGFAAAGLDGWVLAILGDGPLRESLTSLVARLDLTGRVFLGRHAPQRDLIQIAASADVGLLPYQAVGFNHLIATPNKLFEYIQARLPIATSRLPEVERIVAPLGNAGFVDFASASSTPAGLAEFLHQVAPTITPHSLEAAARQVCWERDEAVLLETLERHREADRDSA